VRPFLSIVTRTYRRPTLLANCIESLKAQTDQDFEHIILRDDVGVGIAETYRRLRSQDVNGEYVWVLDDDNVVTSRTFVADLKRFVDDFSKPPFVITEGLVGNRMLPDTPMLQITHIDMMNIVVRCDVWLNSRESFGARYEGDWDFIFAATSGHWMFPKMGGVVAKTQRISKGLPENANTL